MKINLSKYLVLSITLAVTGCSLKPDLVKPEAALPENYLTEVGGLKDADLKSHVAKLGWRTMFGDPRLQKLIELAIKNNRDLRLAMINVDIARAQYGIQRAERLPSIDVNGTATRQRIAANPEVQPGQPSTIQEQYGFNLGLSAFELDLFGRQRSLSEAAFSQYLASEHGRQASHIILVSSVAEAYYAQELAKEQLELARRTLDDWKQSLSLARSLRVANQNSSLDVAQAEGQVATAEADLQSRSRAFTLAGNALQLLIGSPIPKELPESLPLDQQLIITKLPAGLPSELLVYRPDILQAEQRLIAANANIGAARAAFFPRLSLTGTLGYSSTAMNDLFDSGQRVWSFSPQVTLPIFQGGRLRSELRVAELRTSAAVVEYEHAIQTAFREVSDGLAGKATFDQQISAQGRAVASAQERVSLSTLRYRAGLDGRLELLDAQRQLYTQKQQLLDLRRSEFSNAIALYRALGGGLYADNPPDLPTDVTAANYIAK